MLQKPDPTMDECGNLKNAAYLLPQQRSLLGGFQLFPTAISQISLLHISLVAA